MSKQRTTGGKKHNTVELTASDLPLEFRKLIGSLIPENRIAEWLNDKAIFEGQSALELLSISATHEPQALRAAVEQIAFVFLDNLNYFVTVEPHLLPSINSLYNDIVTAQHQVKSIKPLAIAGKKTKQSHRKKPFIPIQFVAEISIDKISRLPEHLRRKAIKSGNKFYLPIENPAHKKNGRKKNRSKLLGTTKILTAESNSRKS